MAHQVEPMDVDCIDSEFDNKENTSHHSNVMPCTEKGYEELDVSELNMKLRYSTTPAASPMSKSYTAATENKYVDDTLNVSIENNLTRSLNSTITKNDSVVKSLKVLPLQSLPTGQFLDGSRNASVLRQLDNTITGESNDIIVKISGPDDNDDNLSLPSSSSSAIHTPEATTPTKEIPRDDGSPIMRGLKSVLNMFRSSQSPIPPVDADNNSVKQEILSPPENSAVEDSPVVKPSATASTPIAVQRNKEGNISKRNSPYKDSIVFNDDLEKELQWKDETTILFSEEKIPIHKLFFQHSKAESKPADVTESEITQVNQNLNTTVEYMDISFNDSAVMDKTVSGNQPNKIDMSIAVESDSEFVDCETTFTKELQLETCKTTEQYTKETNQNEDLTNTIVEENIEFIGDNFDVTKRSFDDILADLTDTINKTHSQSNSSKVENSSLNAICENKNTELTDSKQNDVIKLECSEIKQVPNKTNDDNKTYEHIKFISNETDKVLSEIAIDKLKEDILKNENQMIISSNNNSLIPDIINNEIFNEPTRTESPNMADAIAETIAAESLEDVVVKQSENVEMLEVPQELPVNTPLPDDGDLNNDEALESLTKINILDDENLRPAAMENTNSEIKLDMLVTECSDSLCKNVNDVTSDNLEELCPELLNLFNIVKSDNVDRINVNLSLNEITSVTDSEKSSTDIANVTSLENVNEDGLETMDVNGSVYTLPNITKINTITEHTLPSQIIHEDNCQAIQNPTISSEILPELEGIEEPITENHEKVDADYINHITLVPTDTLKSNEETTNIVEQIIELTKQTDLSSSRNIPTIADKLAEEIALAEITIIDINAAVDCNSTLESPAGLLNTINDGDVNATSISVSEIPCNVAENVQENMFESIPTPIFQETDKMDHPMTIASHEHTDSYMEILKKSNLNGPTNEIVEKQKDDLSEINAIETNIVDEEIIISENNSPFVSVMPDLGVDSEVSTAENFEEIVNPFDTKTDIPSSPPIASKGYNFNFDEMDDPFATKTKIRISPPIETSEKDCNVAIFEKPIDVAKRPANNRRKSQPVRGKPDNLNKKKCNSSFDSSAKISAKASDTKQTKYDTTLNSASSSENLEKSQTRHCTETVSKGKVKSGNNIKCEQNNKVNLTPVESITVSTKIEHTSSSEQSAYYSATSSESSKSRNTFNLPEIDDMNFNPFASKSKIRQSPSPTFDMDNPFVTKTKIASSLDASVITSETINTIFTIEPSSDVTVMADKHSENKLENELMEKDKDLSIDIHNTTSSSKITDEKERTVREVNTEDEDTAEGPFLEVEDQLMKSPEHDIDHVDMMQFNDLPAQPQDDIGGDEVFIDAEAFEFLLNKNNGNVVADSGKESLFLKFDPLFAKRISSDGVLAALSNVQKRQSTPTKASKPMIQKSEISPIAGPSNLNVTFDGDNNVSQESNDDLNVTVAKPTMVVTPAVNPAVTSRKSVTPTRSNRRSVTFTSPAIAVIDRLLSLSANNSFTGHGTSINQTTREQREADLALTQLRELLAEKEINVYNLRSESKELKNRLATLESQMAVLETDGHDRLKKINELNERLNEKTKINKSMAAVVEGYERTIASLIAETEQDKKRHAEERMRLISGRDEQTAHLASMEVSFSDLHSKYEKSKQVILSCKANEDKYKKTISDFEENLTKMQNNYELLKQHATSKLNHANQELDKINRAHEAEILKFNAMIKRKEMHITSLEETLAQKTKANEELTAICDELINKVG